MLPRPGPSAAARRAAALTAALALLGSGVGSAPAAVIVRMPGRGPTAPLSAALAEKLSQARVVELSGDLPADTARISRETKGVSVLFAVGAEATEAAGEARGPAVVSLGVGNPAQLKTPGAYVSIYPNLDRVFEYVKTSLKATHVGLVFSPSLNREIALQFLKAGSAGGVTVLPVTIGSSGDLVREIKGALPKVDALLLAVDRDVIFDQRNLEFIVGEARQARKPTIGFLPELAGLGVTIALVAPPDQAAAAAVAAAAQPVTVGKKRVEVDGMEVIVSRKAAADIGLSGEALGAQKLQ